MITLFGPPEKSESFLDRLKNSVSKTRTELSARFEQLLTGDRPVDPALLSQLENALLSADIGVTTTKEVLAALRRKVTEQKLDGAAALKQELKNQLVQILTVAPALVPGNGKRDAAAAPDPPPAATRTRQRAALLASGSSLRALTRSSGTRPIETSSVDAVISSGIYLLQDPKPSASTSPSALSGSNSK